MSRPVCIDCKAMGELAPKTPRPIHPASGPRSPRCATHRRKMQEAERKRARERRQEKFHQMTAELLAGLEAFQGGRCPCGNALKDTDHDHEIARRMCSHPLSESCPQCWRGRLCAACNRDILGRGYTAARLRALADYLDDPPAPRFLASLEAS